MDIELTAENFMNYMGDEDPNDSQFQGDSMILQHIEDVKKEKESKKDTKYVNTLNIYSSNC